MVLDVVISDVRRGRMVRSTSKKGQSGVPSTSGVEKLSVSPMHLLAMSSPWL